MIGSEQRINLGRGPFSHDQIASTLSPRLQHLIILPTERCNFRCTYCYEDFVIGKMSKSVQDSIERFMERRVPELAELSLSWFGGEPLVARDVVINLSSHASRLCKENGVVLRGGLTTNAYLLDRALFDELLSYDQRFFQITFDGWEEGHDVVRKKANGKGTFSRIWRNLIATKASPDNFSVEIRVHVRRDNFSSLETLVDNIAQNFGGDNRYRMDFEHLRDLGGEGGKTVDRPLSRLELRQIESALRGRFNAIVLSKKNDGSSGESQGKMPALSLGEVKSAEDPHVSSYICYAAKPNSLLIRADGRIGKCTVALSDKRNTIGSIAEDGTLSIDNERLRPWVRGLWDDDPQELHCPLQGLPALVTA